MYIVYYKNLNMLIFLYICLLNKVALIKYMFLTWLLRVISFKITI